MDNITHSIYLPGFEDDNAINKVIKNKTLNMYIGNPFTVNKLQHTILTYFTSRGDIDIVKFALNNGANPNQPSFWARQWIHDKIDSLSSEEKIKCEETNIDNTGYFKYPDDCETPEDGTRKYTYPLESALENGYYDIVLLLLEYGAKWNHVRLDDTLFWLIINYESNKAVECGKLLLEHGANPYAIITKERLIDMALNRWKKENFDAVFMNYIT